MDPLLTTEDVAEFFRLDVVTVRRMIGKGELPAYRVGGEYRLTRADLENYLERQRLPTKTESPRRLGKLAQRARKLVPIGSIPEVFDRFTGRAQSVLALAQEEAHQLKHRYLGTEHLLLGVLREGEGLGATLLHEAGCTLDSVRQAVENTVGPGGPDGGMEGEMPVTPRLKRVLELAWDEAKRLDHSHIGTEHLVLGLLCEGEGVAGRLLKTVGMDVVAARSRVAVLLDRRDER